MAIIFRELRYELSIEGINSIENIDLAWTIENCLSIHRYECELIDKNVNIIVCNPLNFIPEFLEFIVKKNVCYM